MSTSVTGIPKRFDRVLDEMVGAAVEEGRGGIGWDDRVPTLFEGGMRMAK